MNTREIIGTEVSCAIESVQKIRTAIESAEDINGSEASVVNNALEMYKNKFKLNIPSVGVESMVANKDATLKYCNSIITALESRLEGLEVIP